MKDFRVADHFRFRDAGGAILIFFEYLFYVLVPFINFVYVELHREVFCPNP